MNPPKFKECLDELERWAAGRRDIEMAVIYGSVARDTAVDESDLDILLVARAKHQRLLAREIHVIGDRHDVAVSLYIVERGEMGGLNPQFIESLAKDGIALKGDPLDPTVSALDLRPHYLVTLYLDHLPQKKKVRLSRELYGYRSSRRYGRKKYESVSEGLIDRVKGRKLGRGTLLVPARAWPELDVLIKRYKGKRWAFTVWVQNP